jgi:hypothetical protein
MDDNRSELARLAHIAAGMTDAVGLRDIARMMRDQAILHREQARKYERYAETYEQRAAEAARDAQPRLPGAEG